MKHRRAVARILLRKQEREQRQEIQRAVRPDAVTALPFGRRPVRFGQSLQQDCRLAFISADLAHAEQARSRVEPAADTAGRR